PQLFRFHSFNFAMTACALSQLRMPDSIRATKHWGAAMGSIAESWGDALLKLVDPYVQTVEGIWLLASGPAAATLIFVLVLFLLSVEFLRASKGWMKIVGRAASVGSAAFLIAAILYGDFLADPAKAAYSFISERADAVPPKTGAWTTVSIATVSVLAYV